MVSRWFMLLMLNLPQLDICGQGPSRTELVDGCESKTWLKGFLFEKFNNPPFLVSFVRLDFFISALGCLTRINMLTISQKFQIGIVSKNKFPNCLFTPSPHPSFIFSESLTHLQIVGLANARVFVMKKNIFFICKVL